MTTLLIVLRLVHIVFGALWVGVVMFTTVFLGPAVQEAGPAGGAVMGALQRRGVMTFLPMLAHGTLVSGIALYWLVSDGFNPAYVHSRMGATFAIGGALAIAGLAIGIAVMRPAMMQSMTLMQNMGANPTDTQRAELARLRARGGAAGRVVMVLVLLATALMAVARYL